MRALVLSGGGHHGAYENGALQWLLGRLERHYDILCGISVGALNTAVLSMYPHGQEKHAARALQNLWHEVSNRRIFREHLPFGRLMAVCKPSIVNSQPLLDFVAEHFKPEKTLDAKRRLVVGAVSLNSGKYVEFDQNSPHILPAVQASSAYPVFFKPVSFDHQLWADGGIKTIAPLDAAIAAGATEVDLIIAAPADSVYWDNQDPNVFETALRVLELTYEEILDDDVKACMHKHGHVKINVLRPQKELPGSSTDFDPSTRAQMEDLGFGDAQVVWPASL